MYWKVINDYPDGMEPFTKLSLWEAKHVFDSTLDEEIKYFIITVDFQEFWQHVKKDIQSSTSGIHFRHYTPAEFDTPTPAQHNEPLDHNLANEDTNQGRGGRSGGGRGDGAPSKN